MLLFADAMWPAGQGEQEDKPVVSAVLPPWHAVHSLDLGSEANRPKGHGKQTSSPKLLP